MYSRVEAIINLDAIIKNYENTEKIVDADTKIMAVIKADGYGHGAVPIAKQLADYSSLYGYATATMEEAIMLKRNGIKNPILILGYTFLEQYETIVKEEIRPTVFRMDMAKALSEMGVLCKQTVYMHIKINTGMNRIGFPATKESMDEIKAIGKLPNVKIEGIFSHFAKADETNKDSANKQLQVFNTFVQELEADGFSIPYKHISNSAGIIDLKQANLNVVREGISLYGIWPSEEVGKEHLTLQPALELKSHIVYLKTLEVGESISYGGTFTAKKTMRIATIPIGYGDGYPRSLSNKGWVLIRGKKAPICGRICMDQFMVDVTHILDVKDGDEVVLIGKSKDQMLSIEEIGAVAGRFHYEFACDLGKRIPRVYIKGGIVVESKDYF